MKYQFVILFLFTAISLKGNVETNCVGHFKGDSVFIDISVVNNSNNNIYIPYSEWCLSHSRKEFNYQIAYPPPTSSIVSSIYFFSNKYINYEEEKSVISVDYYEFELKYLPKTIVLYVNDTVVFKFKYAYPKTALVDYRANNKATIKIPYFLEDDFAFIFRDVPDVYNYINEEKEIDIDMSIYLITNMNKRNWKKYTTFEIDDCKKNMMFMALQGNELKCSCVIKSSD